jgi:hypothetical protein
VSVNEPSIVLLLTATIDPGVTPMVVRHDPALRLQDYLSALGNWLASGTAPRVVFCENSGYDLAPLKRAAQGHGCEIEFISFFGNQDGATKGKGYAELKIIEHALQESALLARSEVIVKCTGRLTVRNSMRVMRSIATSKFDVMCSLKQYLSFADSRLFAATPSFVRHHLLPQTHIIDDHAGVYFEHALACATASAVAEREQWRPFPTLPRIEGFSGTHGVSMTESRPVSSLKAGLHELRKFVYRN